MHCVLWSFYKHDYLYIKLAKTIEAFIIEKTESCLHMNLGVVILDFGRVLLNGFLWVVDAFDVPLTQYLPLKRICMTRKSKEKSHSKLRKTYWDWIIEKEKLQANGKSFQKTRIRSELQSKLNLTRIVAYWLQESSKIKISHIFIYHLTYKVIWFCMLRYCENLSLLLRVCLCHLLSHLSHDVPNLRQNNTRKQVCVRMNLYAYIGV